MVGIKIGKSGKWNDSDIADSHLQALLEETMENGPEQKRTRLPKLAKIPRRCSGELECYTRMPAPDTVMNNQKFFDRFRKKKNILSTRRQLVSKTLVSGKRATYW